MRLAEIGSPPGADVDRASLETAMKGSEWRPDQQPFGFQDHQSFVITVEHLPGFTAKETTTQSNSLKSASLPRVEVCLAISNN